MSVALASDISYRTDKVWYQGRVGIVRDGARFGAAQGLTCRVGLSILDSNSKGYRVQPRFEVQTAVGPEGPCPGSPRVV